MHPITAGLSGTKSVAKCPHVRRPIATTTAPLAAAYIYIFSCPCWRFPNALFAWRCTSPSTTMLMRKWFTATTSPSSLSFKTSTLIGTLSVIPSWRFLIPWLILPKGQQINHVPQKISKASKIYCKGTNSNESKRGERVGIHKFTGRWEIESPLIKYVYSSIIIEYISQLYSIIIEHFYLSTHSANP